MRGRRIGDTRLDAAAGFDNLWEINGEGSSLPGFTANLDVAAALLDDAVDGGETEAGTVAAFLGGEKRLENTGESGIVHAAAGVADGENDEGAGLAIGESSGGVFVEIDGRSFQRDAAALGHGVSSIFDETGEDLFELDGINLDGTEGASGAKEDVNIVGEAAVEECEGMLDNFVEIEDFGENDLPAAKGEELVREDGGLLGGIANLR